MLNLWYPTWTFFLSVLFSGPQPAAHAPSKVERSARSAVVAPAQPPAGEPAGEAPVTLDSVRLLEGVLIAKAPKQPKASDVVDGVMTFYKGIDRLEAKFKQTYTNNVFGKKSVSVGKLYVMKPARMRWEYQKPEEKFFISNGETLWTYEPKLKQAFKASLQDQLQSVAISFLYGEGDLKKDFDASLDTSRTYGGKDDFVLKLVPKKPSGQYKHLWLVVDSKDFHVKESIVLEPSNNTSHFKFWDLRLNEKTKIRGASAFEFKPPRGVKVIQPQATGPQKQP